MPSRSARRRIPALAVAVLVPVLLVVASCDGGGGADGGGAGGSGGGDVPTAERAATSTSEAPADVVSVSLAEEPEGLNVHLEGQAGRGARKVIGRVWPSAYRIRPDRSAEPWLISDPASVVSTDPYVVEWRIRPDARWSDGTPVSSADFAALAERCRSGTGVECVDAAAYGAVTRVETVDPKTVRVTFEHPVADLAALFRHVPPSHAGGEVPGIWTPGFQGPIGPSAGPFELVEWRAGEGMVLARNDDYFGRRPAIERLVFRFVEPSAQPDALAAGDVDLVTPFPSGRVADEVADVGGATVRIGESAVLERLVFNLEDELLADPAVRRAVALAVDRRALVTSLVRPVHPEARPAGNRLFGSDEASYEDHARDFSGRDVELARAELEAAGFERDGRGVYVRDGKRLELSIATTSGVVRREQEVQLLQAQIAEAGVELHIDNAPPEELEARVAAGDFDLAVVPTPVGAFPTLAADRLYSSDGGRNVSGLAAQRVEELLARADAETTASVRTAVLNDLDVALWELLPDVPLYRVPYLVAFTERLGGVVPQPFSRGHLWNVEDWTVASET